MATAVKNFITFTQGLTPGFWVLSDECRYAKCSSTKKCNSAFSSCGQGLCGNSLGLRLSTLPKLSSGQIHQGDRRQSVGSNLIGKQ